MCKVGLLVLSPKIYFPYIEKEDKIYIREGNRIVSRKLQDAMKVNLLTETIEVDMVPKLIFKSKEKIYRLLEKEEKQYNYREE